MNDHARVATIGVDVGGTSISGGLVNADGHVIAAVQKPTHGSGVGTGVKTLLEVVEQLCARAHAQGWRLDGVGVGLPGPIDVDKGMMRSMALLNYAPEFFEVPIAEQIHALTDLPAYVDNDVNALALGERVFGVGRGVSSFVLMAIGTGVGGAFIVGDAVVRGRQGYAGELGHVPVNFDGPRCMCGGRGCLGAYLGGRLLAEEAQRRVREGARSDLAARAGGDAGAITTKMVFAAAAARDPLAHELIDRACEALAATLAMIVNGLNPELIVLTGGVAESLVPLREDIIRRVGTYAFAAPLTATRIHITPSDKSGTVRGGAALVRYERARRAARPTTE